MLYDVNWQYKANRNPREYYDRIFSSRNIIIIKEISFGLLRGWWEIVGKKVFQNWAEVLKCDFLEGEKTRWWEWMGEIVRWRTIRQAGLPFSQFSLFSLNSFCTNPLLPTFAMNNEDNGTGDNDNKDKDDDNKDNKNNSNSIHFAQLHFLNVQ